MGLRSARAEAPLGKMVLATRGDIMPKSKASESVAKVVDLSATSPKSFEDAIQKGIARASKTIKDLRGAWIKEQKVLVL